MTFLDEVRDRVKTTSAGDALNDHDLRTVSLAVLYALEERIDREIPLYEAICEVER